MDRMKGKGILVLIVFACCGGTGPGCSGSEIAGWQPAVLLQSGLDRPVAVASDETHVYWVEIRLTDDPPNRVFRVPRGGGEPELLYSRVGAVLALAVDSDGCYVGAADEILRIDKQGLGVDTIFDQGCGDSLLARDGALFWWTYDSGPDEAQIHAMRNDGTEHRIGATRVGRPEGALGMDELSVYWGSRATGEILAVSRAASDGEVTVIADEQCPHGVAADQDFVYWHHDDFDCSLNNGTSMRRAPKSGVSDPSLVEEVIDIADNVVQGNDGVYFTVWARLYRAEIPVGSQLGSYSEIGCRSQGGVGHCVTPWAMNVDSIGAVLAGWEGQEGGNGFVLSIPRP